MRPPTASFPDADGASSPPLDRLAWWCRLVLQVLAASFALVGAIFLLRPDATIDAFNAVGTALGGFTPVPPSPVRFWLSLATGYMVLVTALALVAARDLQRMGADPEHAVVAPSGEVHGVSRLHVADASVFPTSTRVNPQLTIMALAMRIATGITRAA